VTSRWPVNWEDLIRGVDCEMCASGRPERDHYGIRVYAGTYTDAYLQRADIQRGYTLAIWRGRHVTEPTELTSAEASGYWNEVLIVARTLISYYAPLKMNYETLGNTLPHLHTHLVPRYQVDPAPGQPFPLLAQNGTEKTIDESRLEQEANDLRSLVLTAR
jgi:diadenosine tetraphosphate (Ap4A) HIT family hydrolase